MQLAKAFGAEVTGVCSTTKVDLVRSLGADHVVDYRREDFAATGTRYDLILDIGGNTSLSRLRRALTPKGTLVIVGGETSGKWLGGSDRQVRAMVLSMFVSQKLGTFIAAVKQEDLLVLAQLPSPGSSRRRSTDVLAGRGAEGDPPRRGGTPRQGRRHDLRSRFLPTRSRQARCRRSADAGAQPSTYSRCRRAASRAGRT